MSLLFVCLLGFGVVFFCCWFGLLFGFVFFNSDWLSFRPRTWIPICSCSPLSLLLEKLEFNLKIYPVCIVQDHNENSTIMGDDGEIHFTSMLLIQAETLMQTSPERSAWTDLASQAVGLVGSLRCPCWHSRTAGGIQAGQLSLLYSTLQALAKIKSDFRSIEGPKIRERERSFRATVLLCADTESHWWKLMCKNCSLMLGKV